MAARRQVRRQANTGGSQAPTQRRRVVQREEQATEQEQFPDDIAEPEGDVIDADGYAADDDDDETASQTSDTPEPEGESKRERFKRLVEPRLNRGLKALGVLGNCGSRASYEYTKLEAEQIVGILRKAVDEVEVSFTATAEKSHVSLTFDD